MTEDELAEITLLHDEEERRDRVLAEFRKLSADPETLRDGLDEVGRHLGRAVVSLYPRRGETANVHRGAGAVHDAINALARLRAALDGER